MFLLIALGAGLLPLSVVALLSRSRGWATVTLLGGGLTLVVGVGGTLLGRYQTDRAAANVPANLVEQLREVGYREAGHNLQLGGALALLITLLGTVAFWRGLQNAPLTRRH